MTTQPAIIIVRNAVKNDAQAVLCAVRGEQLAFGRKLIPTITVNPTWQTAPTHWVMQDYSTTPEIVSMYNQFAVGVLPILGAGLAWGVNGLLSALAAELAVNGLNMQVYSASGDVDSAQWMESVLVSRGLRYVPEMPD